MPSTAALATIEVIENEDLLANARETGEILRMELARAVPDGTISSVRGRGLLCGLELTAGLLARDVALAAIRHGVLVTEAGPSVLRMSPPLTLAPSDAAEGAEAVAQALAEVAA